MCTRVGADLHLKGGCEEQGTVSFLHFLKFGKGTIILISYGGHNKPQKAYRSEKHDVSKYNFAYTSST
jgi:hypothetical protein